MGDTVGLKIRFILDENGTAVREIGRAEQALRKLGSAAKVDEKDLHALGSEAERVFQSTRTAAERYEEELLRLQVLHKKGLISSDTFGRAEANAFKALKAEAGVMPAFLGEIAAAAMPAVTAIGLVGAAVQGLRSVIETGLIEQAAQEQFTALLGSADAADRRLASIHAHWQDLDFSIPELEKASQQLTLFGLDAERELPRVARAADLMGADLQSVVDAIDQAMMGNARGLRRYGIDIQDVLRQTGIDAKNMASLTEEEQRRVVQAILTHWDTGLTDAADTIDDHLTHIGNSFHLLRASIWRDLVEPKANSAIGAVDRFMSHLVEAADPQETARRMESIRSSIVMLARSANPWLGIAAEAYLAHPEVPYVGVADLRRADDSSPPAPKPKGEPHKETPEEAARRKYLAGNPNAYDFAWQVGPDPLTGMGILFTPEQRQAIEDMSAGMTDAGDAMLFAADDAAALRDALKLADETSKRAAEGMTGDWKRASGELAGLFADLATGGIESFRQLGAEFTQMLARMVAQAAATRLSDYVVGGIAGLFGGGGAKAIPIPVGATDLLGINADVTHVGGIAGLAGDRRTVPADIFAHAGRFHAGGFPGLRPGEVPAILQQGEEVLTQRDPRHRANGGAAPQITQNFHITTPDADSFRRSQKQIERDAARGMFRAAFGAR